GGKHVLARVGPGAFDVQDPTLIIHENHVERDGRVLHPEALLLWRIVDEQHASTRRQTATLHEAAGPCGITPGNLDDDACDDRAVGPEEFDHAVGPEGDIRAHAGRLIVIPAGAQW